MKNPQSLQAILRCLIKTAGVIISFITVCMVIQPATGYGQSLSINEISRSVVQIESPDITGSGIFISLDNDIYILTNRHVAAGHDSFTIRVLYDVNEPAKPAYFAGLHSFSPDFDAALLKITSDLDKNPVNALKLACGLYDTDHCIQALKLENDLRDISRGDDVALLGYPGIGENELVYSRGIISSVKYDDYNNERMPVWFRTNADMAPGSSGGLAVTMSGRVIGMPTFVRSESETGGRIGNILSSQVILTSLSSDNIMTSWEGFRDPAGELDTSLLPLYGRVDLEFNSLFEPHIIEVTAGGEKNVSYLDLECTGYAAAAPDYLVNYSGSSETLHILFRATDPQEDATIVIKAPGGTWHCNDDAYEGTLNPAIMFIDPEEGEYLIWVGSYHENTFIEGEIIISDNVPDHHDLPDYKLKPTYGGRDMAVGFLPDPFIISVIAGGSIDLSDTNIGTGCTGFVDAAPDYRIHWSGTGSTLSICFIADESEEDAIMVINSPDGLWHYNDDAHKDTLNPMIVFHDPVEGQYDIWIGSYDENKYIAGFLVISESVEDIP